jgi:selenide,water dikinase
VAPGGSKRNLVYVEPHTKFGADLDGTERLILADAQTSGGLLIAVPPKGEAQLLAELRRARTPAACVIGELVEGISGHMEVTRREGSP